MPLGKWKLSEDHLSHKCWPDLMSYQREFSPHEACHESSFPNPWFPKNCHPAFPLSPLVFSLPLTLPTPSKSHLWTKLLAPKIVTLIFSSLLHCSKIALPFQCHVTATNNVANQVPMRRQRRILRITADPHSIKDQIPSCCPTQGRTVFQCKFLDCPRVRSP